MLDYRLSTSSYRDALASVIKHKEKLRHSNHSYLNFLLPWTGPEYGRSSMVDKGDGDGKEALTEPDSSG